MDYKKALLIITMLITGAATMKIYYRTSEILTTYRECVGDRRAMAAVDRLREEVATPMVTVPRKYARR